MKVFISYSKDDKDIAGNLKRYFEQYKDVECFIAHDDIEPGSEWEKEILDKLSTTEYFLPLQTQSLEESYWCQQEAGIAFNRKIKIIPLKLDTNGKNPVGFYARYQGFKIKASDLSGSVKRFLIREGLIDAEDHEEVEKRMLIFQASDSWAQANKNSQLLLQLEDKFSNADVLRIVGIILSNNQILSSFAARKRLKDFFMRHSEIINSKDFENFLSYE